MSTRYVQSSLYIEFVILVFLYHFNSTLYRKKQKNKRDECFFFNLCSLAVLLALPNYFYLRRAIKIMMPKVVFTVSSAHLKQTCLCFVFTVSIIDYFIVHLRIVQEGELHVEN